MTRRLAHVLAILLLATAAAACSSNSSSPASTTGKSHDSVSVAYAASLQNLNEKVAGPAFTKSSGYGYSGQGNTSGALEAEIAAGELSPNVFQSVGGDNITPLEPAHTTWYVQYAGTSMVLAYNPASKYAAQFKAIADGSKPVRDLFTLLQAPGLKLGRTDPNTDPQGRDFIEMLELAQSYYHLPSGTVAKILGTSDFGSASSSQVYSEASLPATLQSGQLDAGSAFISQAVQLHMAYIPLPVQINLGSAAYAGSYKQASVKIASGTKHGGPQVIDITIIGKPTPAAVAFVKYTLSPAGLAQYRAAGFSLPAPKIFGTGVPAAIASELNG